MKRRFRRLAVLAGATLLAAGAPAHADKIKNPTAVFAGLDKITGRIISFEAAIGETVQFGSLQITARVCYSRPPTEAPQTDAFAEVDEVLENHAAHRIFTGWMFADSPGLHGVEHPVYDIWLTNCKGGTDIIHEAPAVADQPPPDSGGPDLGPLAPPGKPGAGASPTPTPTPKKRKATAAEPGPLDLNGPGAPVVVPLPPPVVTGPLPAPTPRNTPSQRFYPTDDQQLLPPANIGR